jgi:coenzyme F420-0:L-glutamate ligase/coenzyme F420-1:gamma-L-glutamate ligase
MAERVEIIGLPGVPMVQPGDNLHAITVSALVDADLALEAGDVLVVAQKIVSKAEGRFVDVTTVTPSAKAKKLAAETGKDPRFVEIVLSESKRIVRHRENLIIAEHRRGWVMANAGIDHSNVAPGDGREQVLLLPLDPDASARALREELVASYGVPVATVSADRGGAARSASPSAPPGCRRSSIGAATPIYSADRSRSPKPASRTRSRPLPRW